jgi:hypothetical protein
MDVLAWLWWLISGIVTGFASLVWFLISGWVSTLLQIGLLVMVVYFLKYGWQRAPAEIWRRSRSFARFFISWIRAREPPLNADEQAAGVRVVRVKEIGDINISTALSLLMLTGLLLLANMR